MIKHIILLLFLIEGVFSQSSSDTKIFNVGYGVFIIGFGTVLAVIICLIGRATRYPEFFFLISLIIPIFLILFFILVPKEAERAVNEQSSFQTDEYLIPRYIYLVIFIITFTLTSCWVCKFKYFISVIAVRVGTINQEDKDNFFDNEAPKEEEAEKEKIEDKSQNPNQQLRPFGQPPSPNNLQHMRSAGLSPSPFQPVRSLGFGSGFGAGDVRSENVSFVQDRGGTGAGRNIFKRKPGGGFNDSQGFARQDEL